MDESSSKAIAEIGKVSDRIAQQPPEARVLSYGLGVLVLYIPVAKFTTALMAISLLVFALAIVGLYVAVLRSTREPPRTTKRRYDDIFETYYPGSVDRR